MFLISRLHLTGLKKMFCHTYSSYTYKHYIQQYICIRPIFTYVHVDNVEKTATSVEACLNSNGHWFDLEKCTHARRRCTYLNKFYTTNPAQPLT